MPSDGLRVRRAHSVFLSTSSQSRSLILQPYRRCYLLGIEALLPGGNALSPRFHVSASRLACPLHAAVPDLILQSNNKSGPDLIPAAGRYQGCKALAETVTPGWATAACAGLPPTVAYCAFPPLSLPASERFHQRRRFCLPGIPPGRPLLLKVGSTRHQFLLRRDGLTAFRLGGWRWEAPSSAIKPQYWGVEPRSTPTRMQASWAYTRLSTRVGPRTPYTLPAAVRLEC